MIYKRNRIYHYDFWKGGKRFKASCKTGNKSEALCIEADARTNGVGLLRCPTNLDRNFAGSFAEFLAWSSAHVKPKTHKRYRVSGKRLEAYFGLLAISDLHTTTIEQFTRIRKQECTNAGVNRDLACLRTFLNWCNRNGTLQSVPYIKLLPEDSHIIRPVTAEEEVEYFLKADPELAKLSRLILETGMRPGEVFNPKTQWHENYVYITEGKTKYARRTIPLSERAKAVANAAFGISHQVAMRRHKALGVGFRLYDLRHTFGTRMAMAGVDLMTLRELMGHSSITMTQKYCHPNAAHKVAAIQKMEDFNENQRNENQRTPVGDHHKTPVR